MCKQRFQNSYHLSILSLIPVLFWDGWGFIPEGILDFELKSIRSTTSALIPPPGHFLLHAHRDASFGRLISSGSLTYTASVPKSEFHATGMPPSLEPRSCRFTALHKELNLCPKGCSLSFKLGAVSQVPPIFPTTAGEYTGKACLQLDAEMQVVHMEPIGSKNLSPASSQVTVFSWYSWALPIHLICPTRYPLPAIIQGSRGTTRPAKVFHCCLGIERSSFNQLEISFTFVAGHSCCGCNANVHGTPSLWPRVFAARTSQHVDKIRRDKYITKHVINEQGA